MGSVEQIKKKKNGGREGEIFECSGSTTRQKKKAPKSFAHFQFPPAVLQSSFFLCVCGHTTSTGGENIKRRTALAAQTLPQRGKRKQNRHVFLVPRQ